MTKKYPSNFDPLAYALSFLLDKEKSMILYHHPIRGDELHLNWANISIEKAFDQAIDNFVFALDNNNITVEDIDIFLDISFIFKVDTTMRKNYEERAIGALLTTLSNLVGYDIQASDGIIGLKFRDLEASYNEYSTCIFPLPPFRDRVREFFKNYYISHTEKDDYDPNEIFDMYLKYV